MPKAGYVDYDRFDYPLTPKFVASMVSRYVAMLFRILQRPCIMNLTFDQLAEWYDMSNGKLGRGFLQRCRIWLTVVLNVVLATFTVFVVSMRVCVPKEWALRMDVLASDAYVGEVRNRHSCHERKVVEFMCDEVVLSIPIVVSLQDDGNYYIEDGHHRHEARRRRGFSKIRAIVI